MKKSYKCFLFSLFIITFTSSFNFAFADTDIYSRSLSEDTVWTKEGSPYVIYASTEGDSIFTIPIGITLKIEAGVVIKFDYGQSINVLGTLLVNGTSNEKVYFTSIDDDSVGGDTKLDEDLLLPYINDWSGILVTNGGNIKLNNSNISYSGTVLSIYSSSGEINYTDITNCQDGISVNESSFNINNSNISDIFGDALILDTNSSVEFKYSNIKNINGDGINVIDNSILNVEYSNIENVSGDFLFLYLNSTSSIGFSTINTVGGDVFGVYYNSFLNFENSNATNITGQILYMFGNSISNVKNSGIENSADGIIFYNDSLLNIIDSQIKNVAGIDSWTSFLNFYNGSHLNFVNSFLQNISGVAIEAYGYSGSYPTTTLNISDSTISDGNDVGLQIFGSKMSANITKTKVQNFATDGIQTYSYPIISINDSEISNNNNGIVSWGSNVEIKNSIILNNKIFAISNNPAPDFPEIVATDNWWGDASGPYNINTNASGTANQVSDNVDFNPWLNKDPNIKRNPVIIIPGILSSYLNKVSDNTEVWLNLAKALISPSDDFLDQLLLNEKGQIDNNTVLLTTDIFRKLNLFGFEVKDFFDGLIIKLKEEGYVENENLFVFPYDWRLDIREDMTSLNNKILQIREQTGSDKIDIIAHSMGGLLAKYYIKNIGNEKIDKFIDIATPHFGSVDAFNNLMYGGDLGIKFGILRLNPNEIKKIAQNMPSIYQLLPSQDYFSTTSVDYNYYIDDLIDYDNNGIKGRLNYEQSNEFLKNSGRNSYVLDNSINIHDDLDAMNPADYGVKTYNIIGCKIPTIGKIFTLGNEKGKDPEYEIAYITGDGTVPQRSAEGVLSTEQYYVTGEAHSTLPSNNSVKNIVPLLLSGLETGFNFDDYNDISTTSNNCKLSNGTYLSFHSPVNVNIYDEDGNHTGPNINGDVEYLIPEISYDIIENNKFVFLPEGQNYQIKLNATDVGSFSSHIKKIVNGDIVSTEYFSNIPLISTSTKAEVELNVSTSSIILDLLGDGLSNQIIKPSSEILGDSLQDRIAPTTVVKIISGLEISENGEVLKKAELILAPTDVGSGVLKTQYSIDGNTWYEYAGPIKVSTPTIQYFSTDNAGNIELIKLLEIPVLNDIGKQSGVEVQEIPNFIYSYGHSSTSDIYKTIIPENSKLEDNPVLKNEKVYSVSSTSSKIDNKKIKNQLSQKIIQKNIRIDQKQANTNTTLKVNNTASVLESNADSYIDIMYKNISIFLSSIISFVIKYLKL